MSQCPYSPERDCPPGTAKPGCYNNCPQAATVGGAPPAPLALCPFTRERCDVTDRPTPKVINEYRCCVKPCSRVAGPVKTGGYALPAPAVRPTCPFTRLVCPVPEPPESSEGWAKCDALCLTASERLLASQRGRAQSKETAQQPLPVGMMIPATVRLGPVVYEVKQVPHLFNKDDHVTVLGGFIDHAHLLIEVATAYGPAHAGVSFLHELVHAVERFFSLNLEERETECLARGLYMALADNGLLAPQSDANAPPV